MILFPGNSQRENNSSHSNTKVYKGIHMKHHVFVRLAFSLVGIFNGKSILVEEQQWYYFNPLEGNESVHAFPKGVSLAFRLVGIFNGKSILVEEQQWYYFNPLEGNESVHAFPKGISLRDIVIVQL